MFLRDLDDYSENLLHTKIELVSAKALKQRMGKRIFKDVVYMTLLNYGYFIQDIVEVIQHIERYVCGMTYPDFINVRKALAAIYSEFSPPDNGYNRKVYLSNIGLHTLELRNQRQVCQLLADGARKHGIAN